MRMRVRSLALLSGIQHCCELWCRLQRQLGSGVAVAVVQASGYSSDSTSSLLGTSIYQGCSPRKKEKEKKESQPPQPSATTTLSSHQHQGKTL